MVKLNLLEKLDILQLINKDNNFMSDLILRHVFEFDTKFKEMHFAMDDFFNSHITQ